MPIPDQEFYAVRDACERMREALRPFADYYERLERNGRLRGFDLISRQDGNILGHAGIQLQDLKAAYEALNQQFGKQS